MDNFGGPGGDGGGNDADRARSARATRQVAGLRRTARRIAAGHAAQLEWVAQLSADCTTQARGQLADCPPGWGRPSEAELVDSLVTHELMVTLGIPAGEARRLETLATRLVRVLPDTLAALAAGRVDLPRAGFLAEATGMLDDASARAVQALVLPLAGDGPWDGPEPRRWRDQVNRAVVRVDADAARRRREAARPRSRPARSGPGRGATGPGCCRSPRPTTTSCWPTA